MKPLPTDDAAQDALDKKIRPLSQLIMEARRDLPPWRLPSPLCGTLRA